MRRLALLSLLLISLAFAADKLTAPQLAALGESNPGGLRDAITATFDARELKAQQHGEVDIMQPVTSVEGNKPGNRAGPWFRRRFRRIVLRLFLAALALLGIAYAADYVVFRYRLATNRQPFGSVTVEHYYMVAHKDGKAEIIFDPPVP